MERYILCNDEVCEGDKIADSLEEALDKIEYLEQKVLKLKKLLLLTDDSVSHIEVDRTAVKQWREFTSCFPDEK